MIVVYKDKNLQPVKGTNGSMCYDLKCVDTCIIDPHSIKIVNLGIKTNFGWKMYGRSSLPKKGLIFAIGVGIIDEDYRGEVMACLQNITDDPIIITKYDRIAQAEFPEGVKFLEDTEQFNLWQELFVTDRGIGGVGSTDFLIK